MRLVVIRHSWLICDHYLRFVFFAVIFVGFYGFGSLSHASEVRGEHDFAVVDCKRLQADSLCFDAMEFAGERAFVLNRFSENRFDELELKYHMWCKGDERFPDGRWKLREFHEGLYEFFSGSSPKKDLLTIHEWRNRYPLSLAPRYAEAAYWSANAWRVRGGGFAGSVQKEGWVLFDERLAKSRKVFEEIGEKNFDCPILYSLLIEVMTEQGENWEAIEAVFNRGVRKFPEYHGVYFSAARALSPKWGGSVAAYESFARKSAYEAKSFEGMGLYARLYWVDDMKGGIPFSPDSGRPPFWVDLKKGYEELIKLYPFSLHNTGRFASLACRAGDGGVYISLREKFIGAEEWVMSKGFSEACDQRFGWTEKKRSQ